MRGTFTQEEAENRSLELVAKEYTRIKINGFHASEKELHKYLRK